MSPGHGNENMDMSKDKPIALSRIEGTRGPQVEKSKNEVKNKLPWTSPAYDLKNANFQNFAFLKAHRYHRREKRPLQSMSDLNESFWDGLGAEIDGAGPDFQGLRKSSARAEGTLQSFHITPLGINRGRRTGVSLLNPPAPAPLRGA